MWIEIGIRLLFTLSIWSLPVRECGLKWIKLSQICHLLAVTPSAGVWIEICSCLLPRCPCRVTPSAGVWIEIIILPFLEIAPKVTPSAGVWIEIVDVICTSGFAFCHSRCVSVD